MAAQHDVFEQAAEEVRQPPPLPAPEVESLGTGVGYRVRFPSSLVLITVDGIRQGRDGLKGDVRVEMGPFGDRYTTLTEGRLELSSISQRETWERRLSKRSKGAATDWGALLDLCCAAIMQAEKRLDKPAILLRDAARPAATGMLLDPLLLAGLPTLWFGDGGTAKSYLGLAAALSLHAGIPLIGKLEPPHPLRVLYCDFEFEEWEHRERMRRLLKLHPDDPNDTMPDIAYLSCLGGTIVNQVERIMAAIRRHRSQFLVVDSISYAAEGPLNEDETARQYYRTLGYIGLPSLSTGHQPKNGDSRAPFGSVHWRNLCRLAWHFHTCESERQNELLLKLTCEKSNTSQKPAPLGVRMTFGFDQASITTLAGDQLTGDGEELWKRIAALLKAERGRAMTYSEIALALGVEQNVVRARVAGHEDVFTVLKADPPATKARVALRADG